MKKNLFKFLISFFSLFIFIIFYLSFVGIETEKFNQQIKDKVIQSNKDLNIDLKRVKLTLDLLKFSINAKTIGAIIYHSNRPLELEYIKTNVSIDSIFKNKLVSSNFEIATKSILIKDLVKFARSITFRPELLILETIIKDGQIILDLNLNLDQDGKIKNSGLNVIDLANLTRSLSNIDFVTILKFEETNLLLKMETNDTLV